MRNGVCLRDSRYTKYASQCTDYNHCQLNQYLWCHNPKQITEQVMSKNISDIERKLIEKERECEELKVRLRESLIEYEIKKASLDYLASKYHIDLKKDGLD